MLESGGSTAAPVWVALEVLPEERDAGSSSRSEEVDLAAGLALDLFDDTCSSPDGLEANSVGAGGSTSLDLLLGERADDLETLLPEAGGSADLDLLLEELDFLASSASPAPELLAVH